MSTATAEEINKLTIAIHEMEKAVKDCDPENRGKVVEAGPDDICQWQSFQAEFSALEVVLRLVNQATIICRLQTATMRELLKRDKASAIAVHCAGNGKTGTAP